MLFGWRGGERFGGLVVLKRSFMCLDIQSFAHSPALQHLEISSPTMLRARPAIATKKRLITVDSVDV